MSCGKSLLFITLLLALHSPSDLSSDDQVDFHLKDLETRIAIAEKSLQQIEEVKKKQITYYHNKIASSTSEASRKIFEAGLSKFLSNDLSKAQAEALERLKAERNEILMQEIRKAHKKHQDQKPTRSFASEKR